MRQRSALRRLAMVVLLGAAFCSVAVAQIEAIRERGPHTLYGDVKVEAEPSTESAKPLSLEVQLYIINGTLIGRQTVTVPGRYHFMDLPNAEYDVVVMNENTYDEALDLLTRLVAADAKDFQAWTELGTVQLLRNNLEEAEIDYRHAIQERPTFTLALLNLERLLSAQKKYEAAIEPLTEAVKSSSTS